MMGCGSSSTNIKHLASSLEKQQVSSSSTEQKTQTSVRDIRAGTSGPREQQAEIAGTGGVDSPAHREQSGNGGTAMFQAGVHSDTGEGRREEDRAPADPEAGPEVQLDTEPDPSTAANRLTKSKDPVVGLTIEDIQTKMEKYISFLHGVSPTEYTSDEVKEALEFIEKKIVLKRVVERPEVCSAALKAGLLDPVIRIWKTLYDEDFYDPEKKTIWQTMKICLVLLWNSSDRYQAVCERILDMELHVYLLSLLTDPKVSALTDPTTSQTYVVKGALGVLHNTVAKCTAARQQYRDAGAVGIFQTLLEAKYLMVKVKAIINLAYIVNEDENEIINASEKNIGFIAKILSSAMEATNHRSKRYGFTAIETVQALNNLAANDKNKDRILHSGALTHIATLLGEQSSEAEQLEATRGVWTLAFSDECRQAVNASTAITESLTRLKNSDNSKIQKAASGALWTLEGDHTQKESGATAEPAHTKHVMLSYNWGVKPLVLRIRNELVKRGYKVWMDVDDMTGSTLEAMAAAVERASVVVVCMTHKYKESPSCRTEAEYTYQLRKAFIPLRLEAAFKADGWLGIMVGTKLWFDFIRNFELALDGLVRELGDRGRVGAADPVVCTSATPLMTTPAPAQPSYTTWSENEVSDWLKNNGLQENIKSVEGLDGRLLDALRTMRHEAPEFFYMTLRNDLRLGLVSILKFTAALKSLK